MTIFRVNSDMDKATIVKALPQTKEQNKNFIDLTMDLFALERELFKAVGPLQKKLLAQSRKLYTEADKTLKLLKKDKAGNKDEIERVLEVRKYAYQLGAMMKGSLMPY